MAFSDTYRHQVYLSRKDRARRALFWSKVVALVLFVTIGACLRAEPDLRRLVMTVGMDTVARVAGLPSPTGNASHSAPMKLTWKPQKTSHPEGVARPPTPNVKVNRFRPTKPMGAINLEQSLQNRGLIAPVRP